MARVVVLIERYGAAIEYDFHATLGLDLLDFFRHRHTWRKFLRLVDQLPSGSAYWAARADDDEAAESVLRRFGLNPPKAGATPLAEMSATNRLLLDLIDWQQLVVQQLALLRGAKPGTVRPAPRPTTALERARNRVEASDMADLVAEAYAAQARAEQAQADDAR